MSVEGLVSLALLIISAFVEIYDLNNSFIELLRVKQELVNDYKLLNPY